MWRVAVGKVSGRCIHHITGEPAVAGARFHDVEGRGAGRLQHRPHLGQLRRNRLAEQRTDVDAREEVAVASRSLLSARVVAQLGMIQRKLHELGDGQRPARANLRDDVIEQRHQASAGNKKGQGTYPLAFGLYPVGASDLSVCSS